MTLCTRFVIKTPLPCPADELWQVVLEGVLSRSSRRKALFNVEYRDSEMLFATRVGQGLAAHTDMRVPLPRSGTYTFEGSIRMDQRATSTFMVDTDENDEPIIDVAAAIISWDSSYGRASEDHRQFCKWLISWCNARKLDWVAFDEFTRTWHKAPCPIEGAS
jgi:hypothetical protein